jgi:uncharacterized membrane protein
MIKKYKGTLLLTSLMMLIPMLVGLLIWDQLPDPMPSHWNIHGEVDAWSSKAFSVFGFPAILLAVHWLCTLLCTTDPGHKNYHPKMIRLMFWICPMISLVLTTFMYSAALDHSLPIETIMPLLLGLLFVVIGNLMPKCRRSYTMGIKLPWTLASEENWNRTHRFGGKVWVIGGILLMVTSLWGRFWLLLAVLLAMVLIPTIYSYLYYRNHEQNRREDSNEN